MKRIFTVALTLLFAGSVFPFSGCAWGGRVKADVTVEGVVVGGLTYAEAERAVREKIAGGLAPLTVCAPSGNVTFAYPEISFTDDVSALVRRAKRGDRLAARIRRNWAEAERRLEEICAQNARQAVNAELTFSAKGFEYSAGENGVRCDYNALLSDTARALREGGETVMLRCGEYAPEITEESLRARTQALSEFTTYYDGDNRPRSHNIALAAERVSGTVLEPNAEFSFNAAVGKRTAENGFEEATVIQDGEFAKGIGGGVCQTSTTLFNAALRAGMKITESRNHSLAISYVPYSLDAMVSEYSDLKFVNPYAFPVYILARAEGDGVKFEFFGMPDGLRYETESRILLRVKPPEAKIVEGEKNAVLRAEKEGIASESYLLVYNGDGKLLSRTLIRRDSYAAVQGIYQVAPSEEEPPAGEEDGDYGISPHGEGEFELFG